MEKTIRPYTVPTEPEEVHALMRGLHGYGASCEEIAKIWAGVTADDVRKIVEAPKEKPDA